MQLNYPAIIGEADEELVEQEHAVRGTHVAVRVRMLCLLKTGQARTLPDCAQLLGYSYRQVHRWWQTYRSEGLHALLQRGSSPGRPTRLSPQAWRDLEAQMRAGHLASLKDAQAYLRDHWNIAYASLNGIWNQMQRHHAKPKTGRPHHRRQQPDQQTAFKKTSPLLSSTNR